MNRSGAGAVISQKYRLERKLGQGGMGQVWVARHLQLDADVALKLLISEQAGTAGSRGRFEREAKAAAQVKSPHIVHVFDYGVDGETPYIAMELLRGEDLEQRLRREGRLTFSQAAAIAAPVCKALRRIHDAGLVHRDLKPSNVFLERHDDEDHLKILDFGIAKTTALSRTGESTSGIVVGSPPYMSPEQVLARKGLDHRTDLWSLGVILYRALTGKLPFWSEVVTQLLMEICMAPTPRPSQLAPELGPDVDAFFERALAKDPAERFQTAAELADAFRRLDTKNTASAISPSPAPPAPSTNPSEATASFHDAADDTLASDTTVPVAPTPKAPEPAAEPLAAPLPTPALPTASLRTPALPTAPLEAGAYEPAPDSTAVIPASSTPTTSRTRDRSMWLAVATGAVLAALAVAAASAFSPATDQAISGQPSRPVVTGQPEVTAPPRPPSATPAATNAPSATSLTPSPTSSVASSATATSPAGNSGAARSPAPPTDIPARPDTPALPANATSDDGTATAKPGPDDSMVHSPPPAAPEATTPSPSPAPSPTGPGSASPPRREFW